MTGTVAGGAGQFEAKLNAFVRDNRLYGASAGVVHGDELVWSSGVGLAEHAGSRPAGPEVLYRIASITKTFTGTAILQLRDAGELDLDDPIVKWIPELAGSASGGAIDTVTIRRLLSHESGLVSEPPGTDWDGASPTYEGDASHSLHRGSEIFIAVPPNTQHKYCNLGYQLLGEVVSRISGAPYPQYVAEHVLYPLQLSSTAFVPLDPALAARCAVGYTGRSFSDELSVAPSMPPVWAEGGLWSSVTDMARWVSFQLAAYPGPPGREADVVESPVLSARTRREMHAPRYLADETWSTAWGISWYSVRRDDVVWVQHSGGLPGFAANVCFDRASRVGAIVLINGFADASDLAMTLGAQARALAADAPAPGAPAPTPPAIRSLLGLYAPSDLSQLLRVEWRDGKVVITDGDAQTIPLEPGNGPDEFVAAAGFRPSGETVTFTRRADGTVTSMFLGGGTLVRLDPVV